ncbi:MAG: NAD-dependent epimerase/dehydratase family protein [Candidatus Omnitrophica bacterium]|nr:NAD-dependent epimerase/dehydratase family protein [Candidatus Omnitrophota bacterium]
MEDFWKEKKVLVTGGTGFLGKHLIDELSGRKAQVTVLDFRKPNFDVTGFDFLETDIRDAGGDQ